jgi:hypothetical protein
MFSPFALLIAGLLSSNAHASVVGNSCVSKDPNHICLGLKYVVYKNPRGSPVASEADALKNLAVVNQVHSQCNVAFQVEEYDAVDPVGYGLAFNTANSSELDSIREAFADAKRLLIVTTGAWNRSGTLGTSKANAWTAMPGSGPYGAVFEAPVATYSNIFAHELGHYLNLDHVSDPSDILNPVIYRSSTALTENQCEIERAAAERLSARRDVGSLD